MNEEDPAAGGRSFDADLVESSRERGRRDAEERLAPYDGDVRRQVAVALLIATVGEYVRAVGVDGPFRAYVEGVVEVAEEELRPGSPDGREGGPYAAPKTDDKESDT